MASPRVKGTIGKRFTLVIPKEIREQLSLEEHDTVSISIEKGRIIIDPIGKDNFKLLSQLGRDVKYSRKEREKASNILQKLV